MTTCHTKCLSVRGERSLLDTTGASSFCLESSVSLVWQISIFVLPLVVLVGWAIGKPFYLNFDPFITIVLTLSVIHAYFVSSDGNSNWCGLPASIPVDLH